MTILLKKTFGYKEANKLKREKFVEEISEIDPENIVYSDETGIDDNEVPAMEWSIRGEHCYAQKNGVQTTRYNITAALNLNVLFAPFIFEGYSNAKVYEAYIEQILAPSLKPGMVLVIDNARFHKSKKVEQIIEGVGCRILFLPPHSPDFNPIEHFWTAVKNAIRKTAAGTEDFYNAAVETLGCLCTI